jgi:hypothetical protein
MPERVEEEIRASVRKAHPDYSPERVDQEVYAIMNKQGLLKRKHGRRKRNDK